MRRKAAFQIADKPQDIALEVLSDTNVFERIFTCIVWQMMEKGLVGGKYLFTDPESGYMHRDNKPKG
ncbi:hypothetical protein [Glaesserella parasuis]|uniref:hypothetical protein n=1 Tax=Glaesserella parasuis TaxID=738 RepID=UPI0003ABD683|nr:hypothetical protein [Glaesserella parasuis]EQA14035.1 hypothetical protein HPSH465_0487 [Glaesserella parasuis H465]MCT8526507.1 hypothetical protein [Glaesserella parasuis]MCT8528687.1 hypothetical protein [Glaesserella parasuis]MCT8530940.1 hypothetical protein [Glaesserella parasuis]MCT8532989.1 hypothetical protein [Glaesserella parasuis]